jgi:hypothetical protein
MILLMTCHFPTPETLHNLRTPHQLTTEHHVVMLTISSQRVICENSSSMLSFSFQLEKGSDYISIPLGSSVSKRTPVSTVQHRATFSFVYPPPPVTCRGVTSCEL